MYQTLVTPPNKASKHTPSTFRYAVFNKPQFTAEEEFSAPPLKITVSMQPMEIVQKAPHANPSDALLSPTSSISVQRNLSRVPSELPDLVSYSSHETDETKPSAQSSKPLRPDQSSKNQALKKIRSLRIQTEVPPSAHTRLLSMKTQAPSVTYERTSQFSSMSVRGDGSTYDCETEDEEEGDISSVLATAGRGTSVCDKSIASTEDFHSMAFEHFPRPPTGQIKLSKRSSVVSSIDSEITRVREETVQRYRTRLTVRLQEVFSEFETKIDGLVASAESDFTYLKSEFAKRSRRSSRSD